MLGGNRQRFAEAQFIGFVECWFMPPALGLVGDEDDGLATAADPAGEFAVGRGYAGAGIEDEEHDIAVIHRHLGLRTHAGFEAVALDVVEAGRIEDAEAQVAKPRLAFAAVTGDAGLVIDEGDLAADEPVEQGRLADIRPPHDGDGCCHCGSLKVSLVVVGGLQAGSLAVQPEAPAGCDAVPTCESPFSGNDGRPGMASSRWPGRTLLLVWPVTESR